MAVSQRPYHHGNLRAALLARAEETLSQEGAGELSLRELARQVGVSHAAPRRHFPDKQALLDALAEDGFERLGRDLREALDAAGERFEDRLLAFAQAYVALRHPPRRAARADVRRQAPARRGRRACARRPTAPSRRRSRCSPRARPRARSSRARSSASRSSPGPRSRASPSLVNAGMLDQAGLDEVVADAVHRLLLGLRPR